MENQTKNHLQQLFLRIALSVTLLSAVADRLGFWGKNSNWGNWTNFENYTRELTFFLPQSLSVFSAYTATLLETVLAITLLIGFKTKISAFSAGILLLVFAFSMTFSIGVKPPLDYSVWVGSAAAFLLSTQNQFKFSIDNKFINQ